MLFYSLKEIALLLNVDPPVIWDALHAANVKMTYKGQDARRPAFGLCQEVQEVPNLNRKHPTDPLVITEFLEYPGLSPNPSHITILVDHLPATWQSRLREARMAQMHAGQGTPEYQRDASNVEAAVKRLDDAKANLAMMTEALANAPKTGDVEKIRNAQAAVNEAQQDVERAQAAIERRRGDDPLMEEAAFFDGFDSATLGHGLEADHWVTLPVVQAKHAAMLMAGINPTHYPDPDQRAPSYADLPKYRTALNTFESYGQDGFKRSLRDWVGLAQSHGLQIDVRVLAAVASVPAPSDSMPRHELADEAPKAVVATTEIVGVESSYETPAVSLNVVERCQSEASLTGVVGHTKDYMLEVMRAAQWSSVKELYRELVRRADHPGSPFSKGTGHALGKLYVNELNKTL